MYDSERRVKDFLLSWQFREDENQGIEVSFVVLESILAATDNFSEANKLGQGGFGSVYMVIQHFSLLHSQLYFSPKKKKKSYTYDALIELFFQGKFLGGHEFALRRLSSGSGQGLEEFKNEVVLIAKLQHRNLVRLLGYCVEGDEKMLLYEFMPNKSLYSFIFGEFSPAQISNFQYDNTFILMNAVTRNSRYLVVICLRSMHYMGCSQPSPTFSVLV